MSWIDIPNDSDFTTDNIPYGIFSTSSRNARIGVAIGDQILDLKRLAGLGFFSNLGIDTSVFAKSFLNEFIALGKDTTSKVRWKIQNWLTRGDSAIRKYAAEVLVPQSDARMHLPIQIGDYTDFFSSLEHATNVGKMFRDRENALLPNWRHLPVAYHGRASSIVVSGTPVRRPQGQTKSKTGQLRFGPSTNLDFELEMAYIIGKSTELGQPLSTGEASDYIFGMVIFNDWSARDIQKWEYVPLGPFLSKNFASSISPWVVTLEALSFASTKGPHQDPPVLPYLQYEGRLNYDINLEVGIKPKDAEEQIVCSGNFKYMYWNMAQQLAHHTVNGCNINVGDVMASGTISGKSRDSFGSLLELSWSGFNPIKMKDGSTRTFLRDFDTVIMRAHAAKAGKRVGFGELRGLILPSH